MEKSVTMTLRQVNEEMQAAGIRCGMKVISDGIATGAYPFGRVVNVGETGRRTIQIFRVDFEAWLATKLPKQDSTSTQTLQLRKSV